MKPGRPIFHRFLSGSTEAHLWDDTVEMVRARNTRESSRECHPGQGDLEPRARWHYGQRLDKTTADQRQEVIIVN